MAESTAPSTPKESNEATLNGGESKDGKYGGKTPQEHSDVSLKDYDPSDDKFDRKTRVVTDVRTGASLSISDTDDEVPGLDEARAEADGKDPNVPASVKPAETTTKDSGTSGTANR